MKLTIKKLKEMIQEEINELHVDAPTAMDSAQTLDMVGPSDEMVEWVRNWNPEGPFIPNARWTRTGGFLNAFLEKFPDVPRPSTLQSSGADVPPYRKLMDDIMARLSEESMSAPPGA